MRAALCRLGRHSTRLHHAQGSDVFCKIIRGEIPCKKRFETDHILAFDDLSPIAPVHILIVPKCHTRGISNLFGSEVEAPGEASIPLAACGSDLPSDAEVVGMMYTAAAKIAESLGLDKSGYRLVINNGNDGGQTVPHLHLHLLGGRKFSWPPG